nr:hypothetical protein BaRGS_004671 [Batillaria attramentaria]
MQDRRGCTSVHAAPKSFRFQGLLDRHMRKHKEDTDICPHCGKVYISKVHLQRHISVVHLGVKDYRFKCDQCGAQFFESIQLRDHIAYRHHGIQLYQCRFCHKGFNCRPTMVRHERKMHTGYLPYVCKHCGSALKDALRTFTLVSSHMVAAICGRAYIKRWHLQQHLRKSHNAMGVSVAGVSPAHPVLQSDDQLVIQGL